MLASFDLYEHPIYMVLCSYALSSIIVLCTDRFALPPSQRQAQIDECSFSEQIADVGASLLVIAYVYACFFAISWRPIYASQGTISFFVIFTLISRVKYQFIREPLVFSDLAMVLDVFKYKTIFYATWLNLAFWLFAVLYVFGASALYMYFEPHLLPQDSSTMLMVLLPLALIGLTAILTQKPVVHLMAARCSTLLNGFDAKQSTRNFGTFPAITLQFLAWLGSNRDHIINEFKNDDRHLRKQIAKSQQDENAPLIVIWQSESFIDLRHFGVNDLELPNIDRLKRKAVQWGRLANIFEGGYTLRTEFAMLSGLPPHLVPSDASYPYLRAAHYSDIVWPSKLKNAGWRTHFIHPYDEKFFSRHKAMPSLGFDEMTMLDAFEHDPSRDGPYVSDRILAKKVATFAAQTALSDPALFFVASMGNHGPWEPGRFGDLTDPVSIYMHLLKEADTAIGQLQDALKTLNRPVWLTFYGDHAPLLKSFADPFPDPRTDYFIVPLSKAAKKVTTAATKPVTPSDEAPWAVFEHMLGHAGLLKGAL